jgi:predicted transcriptional regulator
MPKRFHVQLPDDADASLGRLAEARGTSKAALARYAILRLLGAVREDTRGRTKADLATPAHETSLNKSDA